MERKSTATAWLGSRSFCPFGMSGITLCVGGRNSGDGQALVGRRGRRLVCGPGGASLKGGGTQAVGEAGACTSACALAVQLCPPAVSPPHPRMPPLDARSQTITLTAAAGAVFTAARISPNLAQQVSAQSLRVWKRTFGDANCEGGGGGGRAGGRVRERRGRGGLRARRLCALAGCHTPATSACPLRPRK